MTREEVLAEIRRLYTEALDVYGAADTSDDESSSEAYGHGLMDAYAECVALLEDLEGRS